MGRALLVGRPAALARDLALFFRRHRRESSTFFAFSSIHHRLPVLLRVGVNDIGTLAVGWRGILDSRGPRLVRRRFRHLVRDLFLVVPVLILGADLHLTPALSNRVPCRSFVPSLLTS